MSQGQEGSEERDACGKVIKYWGRENGKAQHGLSDRSQRSVFKPAYHGCHSNMANIQISVNSGTDLCIKGHRVCGQLARHKMKIKC